MERKRRLPPRAAARQEQAAKRRYIPPRGQSSTPAVVEPPPREPTPPPPPLPKSIEVGKPLPTVEEAQPTDLSSKEYQSLTESGVLTESLSRSRQRWISDGLFEKFWTKPHKRKGVLQEDPNNPPKDSMMKVGNVTITIEPHIVEATMYAVKTSKLLPHQQQRFNPRPQPKPQQQVSGEVSQLEPAQAQGPEAQPQQQANAKSTPPAGQQSQPQTQPITQPTTSALARPVLQYGPHNGTMPPQSTLATAHMTPSTNPRATGTTPSALPAANTAASNPPIQANPAPVATANAPSAAPPAFAPSATVPVAAAGSGPAPATSVASANAAASPHPGIAPKAQPDAGPAAGSAAASQTLPAQPQAQQPAPAGHKPPQQPSAVVPQNPAQPGTAAAFAPQRVAPTQGSLQPGVTAQPLARPTSNPPQTPAAVPAPVGQPGHSATSRPAGAINQPPPTASGKPAAKPAANDPVIALLAQKASRDPELRELMKRVAVGEAKDGELAKFQKIIDQLNAEYRQKGGQQGPSADRLLVDGRTVKYFADEVRTILDIVLASNPNQKSSELRPPPRSDPLVVLLVKTALEDQRTKDMIRRIAEGKPGFTDATDLKQILDRLHRDAKITPKAPLPGPSPLRAPVTGGPSGPSGGGQQLKAHAPPPPPPQHNNPQALRSKGPPPSHRPDISAVALDFGSGDRYLFPKYSVLEFLPTQSGQQVVASFLIVRKGSTAEYGGDPKLDYYQPVTIRLQTTSGRHLENLARVVAPQDEVRRYMDDVMDNMTRAEYVLLAMRLPRADFEPEEGADAVEDSKASSPTPKSEPETDQNATPKPGVLWTTGRNNKTVDPSLSVKLQDPEQEAQTKYERLIRSVAEKEVDGL